MVSYFTTAALVFSFVSYVFVKDQAARKDDLGAWLFIALAALIWPVTLPNMIRKVVASWLQSRSSQADPAGPAASRA